MQFHGRTLAKPTVERPGTSVLLFTRCEPTSATPQQESIPMNETTLVENPFTHGNGAAQGLEAELEVLSEPLLVSAT